MGQNALKVLPTSICYLYNLRQISIKHNELTRLPDDFGNMKSLRSVDLSHNKLRTLPSSIGNLKNLVIFNLSCNAIEYLPDSIGNLDKLEAMNLSQNTLLSIPCSFSRLACLSTLDLSRNALSSLPESFGSLSSLAWLCLDSNKLTELPGAFGELKRLKCLYLDNNHLRGLPESFGNLVDVEIVSISFNFELALLPQTFGNLCNLQDLFLNYCRLSQLPESFSRLSRLRNLGLNGNELKSLSESFGNLKGLKALYLNTNTHLQLPSMLPKLKKLERLYLNGIMMKDVPSDFCNLRSLKYLNLNHNELSKLPENVGNLTNLIELSVSSCQLRSIPSSIGKLINLRELSLFNNTIKSLPNSIIDIKSTLVSLDLGKNCLDEFGTGFSLGYSELLQVFGTKLVHTHKASFRYLSSITTEELYAKLYNNRPHWGIKALKSLSIKPVVSQSLSEDDAMDILDGVLAPYIKSSDDLDHLRKYVRHLYNPSTYFDDWPMSPFYAGLARDLLESILLLLLGRNPIDFIDYAVVRICEASKVRKDKQVARLRFVFYYLSSCPGMDLEKFIFMFITQEKENMFNHIASYFSTVESMDAISYWKYQVRDELGFDHAPMCTDLRIDIQDPFSGHPGNFLYTFYSKFTPSHVVTELTKAINSDSLVLCDALNRLRDENISEDQKTKMYISEKGLLYATGITQKYVEHVLLRMGIISNYTPRDQNMEESVMWISTLSIAVAFLLVYLLASAAST